MDETDARREVASCFERAAASQAIVGARFDVLAALASGLPAIGNRLHSVGWIVKSDLLLAHALLARLAGSLCSGLEELLRGENVYAAAALLRQLIEVEYLLFLGYLDPDRLAQWYRSDPRSLRREFSPQRMRNVSGGLFRDVEYWQHCVVGGHPHPEARRVLSGYEHAVEPSSFLVPDAVHHARRMWTSLRLSIESMEHSSSLLGSESATVSGALDVWTTIEDPLILSADGIATRGHEPPDDDSDLAGQGTCRRQVRR